MVKEKIKNLSGRDLQLAIIGQNEELEWVLIYHDSIRDLQSKFFRYKKRTLKVLKQMDTKTLKSILQKNTTYILLKVLLDQLITLDTI